jgi:hypothetical protein
MAMGSSVRNDGSLLKHSEERTERREDTELMDRTSLQLDFVLPSSTVIANCIPLRVGVLLNDPKAACRRPAARLLPPSGVRVQNSTSTSLSVRNWTNWRPLAGATPRSIGTVFPKCMRLLNAHLVLARGLACSLASTTLTRYLTLGTLASTYDWRRKKDAAEHSKGRRRKHKKRQSTEFAFLASPSCHPLQSAISQAHSDFFCTQGLFLNPQDSRPYPIRVLTVSA